MKTRYKFMFLLLVALMVFSPCSPAGLNAARAQGSSHDCAEAMDSWWDRLAMLNPGEIESFFVYTDRAVSSLWKPVNEKGPVLSLAEQKFLYQKLVLNYDGFRLVPTFNDYINNISCKGEKGYKGFWNSIQPGQRDYDYLAGLCEKLSLSLPSGFRAELAGTYNFSEQEQIALFLQLVNLEFEYLDLEQVWPAVAAVFDQYLVQKSKIDAPMLEAMGFTKENLAEIAGVFLPGEKAELAAILKKMGNYHPPAAAVSGAVYLEGRENHAGILVEITLGESLVKTVYTVDDGSFAFEGLTAGAYNLIFSKSGWKKKAIELSLAVDEEKVMPAVTLTLGDLNGDGYINVADLLWIAPKIGLRPEMTGWDETADINQDGYINVLDLIKVAKNIGK